MHVQKTANQNVYVNLLLHLCGNMIAMLGLFTVVT